MAKRTQLVSAREIAAELGITKSMVHRLAIRRGLGVMVGNQRLFTPAEMDNLRVRQRGRPRGATQEYIHADYPPEAYEGLLS